MGFNSNKMNTIASCFLACLLALLMSESCFGVPMGPISINYDFLEPLDPAMLVHPDEPSMVDYPNEPSMVDDLGLDPAMLGHPDEPSMADYPNEPSMEYPVGHTGPDMNENIMGSRVRRSMVDYPMDPSMYPLMEYPMGSDGHTEPDMEDNMMGARSRRSPREPCNQQTIPEIPKC